MGDSSLSECSRAYGVFDMEVFIILPFLPFSSQFVMHFLHSGLICLKRIKTVAPTEILAFKHLLKYLAQGTDIISRFLLNK